MVELEIFGALCATKIFKINGKSANSEDFGNSEDVESETAEPYGCGNRRFLPKPATSAILKEYGISVDEYNEIADMLREKLSFGTCGWCV